MANFAIYDELGNYIGEDRDDASDQPVGTSGGVPDPVIGPNDWLYDGSKKPTLVIPGFDWVWNGSQWTTTSTTSNLNTTNTNTTVNPPTIDPNDYRITGPGPGGPGGVGGGGGGGGAGYDPANFDWPELDIPEYTNPYGDYVPATWTPPKPEDVRLDPSYQFRLDESMKPIVNQRALQGLTRGGATMKALSNYASNFASDEYGRIFDRSAYTFDLNEKNRKGAFDSNVQNWNTGYEYGVDEAKLEFAPKFDAAKLQFGQNFDIWKYLNDDAFRYWNSALGASTQGSQFGNDEP